MVPSNNLKGINIIKATNILTAKSPKDNVTHGIPVEKKDKKKNKNVSIVDPKIEEVIGATNHFFFLNLSKIWTSSNWATRKADPEPMAILTEIKSAKCDENKSVKLTPNIKPI